VYYVGDSEYLAVKNASLYIVLQDNDLLAAAQQTGVAMNLPDKFIDSQPGAVIAAKNDISPLEVLDLRSGSVADLDIRICTLLELAEPDIRSELYNAGVFGLPVYLSQDNVRAMHQLRITADRLQLAWITEQNYRLAEVVQVRPEVAAYHTAHK